MTDTQTGEDNCQPPAYRHHHVFVGVVLALARCRPTAGGTVANAGGRSLWTTMVAAGGGCQTSRAYGRRAPAERKTVIVRMNLKWSMCGWCEVAGARGRRLRVPRLRTKIRALPPTVQNNVAARTVRQHVPRCGPAGLGTAGGPRNHPTPRDPLHALSHRAPGAFILWRPAPRQKHKHLSCALWCALGDC